MRPGKKCKNSCAPSTYLTSIDRRFLDDTGRGCFEFPTPYSVTPDSRQRSLLSQDDSTTAVISRHLLPQTVKSCLEVLVEGVAATTAAAATNCLGNSALGHGRVSYRCGSFAEL